jgi:hypothetical protein
MEPEKRFLIITTTKNGFWYEMHHVLTQLVMAEITGRIPVVFWGKGCMYSIPGADNAFEQYFLPVSEYTVNDLNRVSETYSTDILEADKHMEIEDIIKFIDIESPYYGLDSGELFKIMLKKYIRLRPEIEEEIDDFYGSNIEGKTAIAVHIRGSDKILEVSHLHELNRRYPEKINRLVRALPSACIFLMTDCKDILEDYKEMYGYKVICTDCKRVYRKTDTGVHFQEYENKKQKGLEVIRDTWLAARCNYFIGNGFSNVSRGICELADWKNDEVELIY